MSLKEQLNGLQHIGVPTKNIEETIEFYGKLGFEIAFQTVNDGGKVAFLKMENLVIETYENEDATMKSGAVDHIALDVKDIEKVYELINQEGLNTTQDVKNIVNQTKKMAAGRLDFFDIFFHLYRISQFMFHKL